VNSTKLSENRGVLVRLDSEFVVGVYLLGTRIRQFFDLQVFVLKRANFCLRVSQKLFVYSWLQMDCKVLGA